MCAGETKKNEIPIVKKVQKQKMEPPISSLNHENVRNNDI